MIRYVHVPGNKAYYKVMEDCCYEIVSYDDKNKGETTRSERGGLEIFNSKLLCCCYEGYIEISEEEYLKHKRIIQQE